MQKGDTVIILLVMFGALVAVFVLTVIVSRPFWSVYGDIQAQVVADGIASDITSLSAAERGTVSKKFNGKWNIKITQTEVEVFYKKYNAKSKIVTNKQIEGKDLGEKDSIIITKEDDKIKVV